MEKRIKQSTIDKIKNLNSRIYDKGNDADIRGVISCFEKIINVLEKDEIEDEELKKEVLLSIKDSSEDCEKTLEGKGWEIVRAKTIGAESLDEINDIGQDYGVDLITFFTAIRKGFYTKTYHNNIEFIPKNDVISVYFDLGRIEYCICGSGPVRHVYLKDIGKTWATKKEDLE